MNFFFQRQLMTFARKGFLAMCFCRSPPGIQGTVGNAQFSCDLRFRFVTGLGQLNRFLLELSRKTWLWFWHRDLFFKTGLSTFYHSTIPGEDQEPRCARFVALKGLEVAFYLRGEIIGYSPTRCNALIALVVSDIR